MGATCTFKKDPATGNCVNNPWPYYGSFQGTSFATPIVAGVCALMKSVNSSLTPWAIQDIIKMTADPVNDAYLYPGLVGAGRINAYKAVKVANCDFSDFPSPSINGPDIVCSSNSTFKLIHRLPGSKIEWLHSNNTIQAGSQNTENYTIKGNASFPADSGWVKAILHKPGCGTDTLKKSFWVDKLPATPTIICPYTKVGLNSLIEVNAVGPGAENYNWSVGGGTITSGQGTSDIWIMTSSSCLYDLTIRLTTSNACGNSTEAVKSIPFDCSGGITPLSVSPNPASQTITVELKDTQATTTETSGKGFIVKLLDSYYIPVYQKKLKANRFTINVSRYRAGIYYLQVVKGNKMYSKKVIITKR